MRKAGKFNNDHTRFYAAQIVMALQVRPLVRVRVRARVSRPSPCRTVHYPNPNPTPDPNPDPKCMRL